MFTAEEKKNVIDEMQNYMEGISIINTHCHHWRSDILVNTGIDFLLSNSYPGWTTNAPSHEKDDICSYINRYRSNSYFRWLFLALEKLYNLSFTAENFDKLDIKIKEANGDPGYNIRILKNVCKYEKVILDYYMEPGSNNGHPELFTPTYRIDMYLNGWKYDGEDINGVKVRDMVDMSAVESLEDYIKVMEDQIVLHKKMGCVALKLATAYERDNHFTNNNYKLAEEAFNNKDASAEQIKNFGDYIVWKASEFSAKYDMPFQIHTGLGKIENSNAINLVKLIKENPQTKFVLFHGGFPWTDDILALLHNCKNVYADICWLPMISPVTAVRFIKEALETADAHRICWGCDTWTSEESYGAVIAFKHVLSLALADMIEDGAFDIEYAKYIAARIMRDNAKGIFGI